VPLTAAIEANPSAGQVHSSRPSLTASISTPAIPRSLQDARIVYTSADELVVFTDQPLNSSHGQIRMGRVRAGEKLGSGVSGRALYPAASRIVPEGFERYLLVMETATRLPVGVLRPNIPELHDRLRLLMTLKCILVMKMENPFTWVRTAYPACIIDCDSQP
jgi:hypothetical protein